MKPEVVDLVPFENTVTLFGSNEPASVIVRATNVAKPLANVIKERHLFAQIRQKKYVTVEGWTLLGTMLGVFPVVVWSRPIEGGWEARVEAKTLHGEVVGAAEAQCTRAESSWKSRDDYALRSMAQTRATSKALRLPLGFVMSMAGYDTTPLEEMIEAPSLQGDTEAGPPKPSKAADGQAEVPASSARNQGAKTPGEEAVVDSDGPSPPPLTLREALEKRYPGRLIIQTQRERQICKDHKVNTIEELELDTLNAITAQVLSEAS